MVRIFLCFFWSHILLLLTIAYKNNDDVINLPNNATMLLRVLQNDMASNAPSFLIINGEKSETFAPSNEASSVPTSPSAIDMSDGPSLYTSDYPTITPSFYPSTYPSTSNSPTTSNAPSDQPSDIPSSHPTLEPSTFPSLMPSLEPTPITTNTTELANIILILINVNASVNVSAFPQQFATITSQHVQQYWNDDLSSSPFFIGAVQTRLLDEVRERNFEELPSISIDCQSNPNLPLRLTYVQTINYTRVGDPIIYDRDFPRQLFILPFTQNPLAYTNNFVIRIQNNTGHVFFQSIQLNEVPTQAPTFELPIVERKRNIIISTVVAFVGTLLIFVGGHIMYLIHFKDSESVSEMQPNILRDDVEGGRDDFYPERSNYSDPKSVSDNIFGSVTDHNTISRFELPVDDSQQLGHLSNPLIREKQPYIEKDEAFDINGDNRSSLLETDDLSLQDTEGNQLFESIESNINPLPADSRTWSELMDYKESSGNEIVEFGPQQSYRSSTIESDGGSLSSSQDSSSQILEQNVLDDGDSTHLMFMNMGNFQMQIQDLE